MRHLASVFVILFVLASCAQPPVSANSSDAYEKTNRETHDANADLDRAVVRPMARAYGNGLPQPARAAISNFGRNLFLPSVVINNLLQAKLEDAAHNSTRFLFNSTLGLFGLFDIATDIGLEERYTDASGTLYAWGVPEGEFVMLPFIGPSTERDAVGLVIDLAFNPLASYMPGNAKYLSQASWVFTRLDERYTFGTIYDGFFDTPEGYEKLRLYYLDSRRYTLGVVVKDDELEDIYDGYDW